MSTPTPRRVFGLSLSDVLGQALDSAFSVDDTDERLDLVEQVAHSAVEHGAVDVAREVLLDLPERSVRALLHTRLLERFHGQGDLDLARHHARQAIAETRRDDRWMPRTGWLTPDAARVDLIRKSVTIGDIAQARELLSELPQGTPAAALGRVALADPADPQRWRDALDAVSTIDTAPDRRAALQDLVTLAAKAGMADRVEALVGDQAEHLDAVQRQVLVEHAAQALAETGLTVAAGRLWEHAARLATRDAQPTAALCRIAQLQATLGSLEPAVQTLRIAIETVRDSVLPPDPGDAYPWRTIYRTVWSNVALADPLRAVLRTRRTLAPAWCFVLGELEHAAGQVERGRRAAAALESAHEADPSDLEPLWLAALLHAHTGDLHRAVPAMRQVLAQLPAGTKVRLPGDDDEAAWIETHFATALLRAGQIAAAVDLARTAPPGELRATVLHRAARSSARAGDRELAIELCNEAGDSLAPGTPQTERSARGLGVLPGEIARLLWSLGEHEAAREVIADAITATRQVSGPLGMNLLCDLEARAAAARAQPLVELLRQEGADRVRQAPPADRCRLLLVMAEAAVAPPKGHAG